VTLFVATLFALAAYLIVRALAVESKAPASAWRDATFRQMHQPDPARARAPGSALRTRSTLERLVEALPNLDRLQEPAQKAVEAAGLAPRLTGASLMGICAVAGATMALLALVYTAADGFTPKELASIPLAGVLGAGAPLISVSGRASRRREAIEHALPDTLDLLVVSIEAGLALEAALQRVSARSSDPLTQEIQRVLNEVALGRRRYDALVSLGTRCGVQSLQTLVNAMNQAERTGMQLGPVLRAQSEQIRMRRRQAAEERAMKAPVKMLVPLALFIFPAMFLVILGPAALAFMAQ
jgi:tight adherence protein C